MRGMLEDDMTNRKNQQLKDLQAFQKRQAEEKRNNEKNWKNNQENQNQFEISRTNMSEFMTEARQTTSSELAPHRYVPYHFKGLRADQIDMIKSERNQQVVQADEDRRNNASEEYSWAVQNLANTQHKLNNEIDLQNKNADMNAAQSIHNQQETQDKNARWPNMYGDLDKLPEVTKDMVQGAVSRPVM